MSIASRNRRTLASYFVAPIILLAGGGIVSAWYWQENRAITRQQNSADEELAESKRVMDVHKGLIAQIAENQADHEETMEDLKAYGKGLMSSKEVTERREKRDRFRKEKQREREDERRHQEMLEAIRESKK